MTFDTIPFEDAMFSGIEGIIKYYEPHIKGVVIKHEDRNRATLNEDDLAQECRLTIARCWETIQKKCLSDKSINNFDLMVKRAIHNVILTQIGKEFCQKRGRSNQISFFTDVVGRNLNEKGKNEVDFEAVLFQSSQQSYTKNESGLNILVQNINDHLDAPELITTFNHIIVNYNFTDLQPGKISVNKQKKIAKELSITESRVVENIENISFILHGYRANFLQASSL